MYKNSRQVVWPCLLVVALLGFAAPSPGQTGGGKSLITRPVDDSQRTVLRGNTYPLALPQYDRGPAPAGLSLSRMILVLRRGADQQAALGKLLDAQQEKGSTSYHQWLTPAQFGRQFGPSDQDIATIVGWLDSHGFQVDEAGNGRGVIEFSGTAGEVQAAFHTAIHQYEVAGKSHWANASDPEIPTALAPAVAGIVSLNDFHRRPAHHVVGIFRKSKTTGQAIPAQPGFNTGCGASPCFALGPDDFATIYNVLPLWNASMDGTGQTIAIVAQSDINPQDVADFRSMFAMPPAKLQIIHNGPDPGLMADSGDEGESDLDVEWAGAVAKRATIDFVVSESTETSSGVDLSAEYIVDNDLAPVMSESYEECELGLGTAGNQFYDQLWQQAAAEGITAFVASGDGGAALCDQGNPGASLGLTVNGIASSPYDVAVGGTDFNDALNPATYWNLTNDPNTQGSAKGYIPETTWNDTCTNAELAQIAGGSTDAEANCNNASLLSNIPALLDVSGGSGGASNCTTSKGLALSSCSGGYAKPSWQTGNGVPSDSKRDLPDVSLFASNGFNGNFYVVCESDALGGAPCDLASGEFTGVGGTSASSPAFAGIMAMVDEKTQSRQGDADYVLYPLAAKSGATCASSATAASSCVFYDVTVGTIAMPCVSGTPDCKTSSGGDAHGVQTGYATTAGYDPATGLGSVNAANLVNAWSSISFQPSTTTLQLNGGSAVNAVHGTPVAFSIGVSPSSPAPTGSVSLLATQAGSSFQVGAFALSSDSVTGLTSHLPGGNSYGVTAYYPGNGTYGASNSAPVTVTVSPEASKTFANLVTRDATGKITSYSAGSATYGSGFSYLRIDVGNTAASYSSSSGISSSCSTQAASCPTGAVTVTAAAVPLAAGSFPLGVEGYAEDQSLAAGSYLVTASYPGDASYGPSSATASFTIAPAPTTASVSAPTTPVQFGQSVPISAAIATGSDGVEPTGTFSLLVNGSPVPTSSLTYQGTPFNASAFPPSFAGYAVSGLGEFLSVGSNQLTAQYSGDANYAGSTSAPITVTVTQAAPVFAAINANPAQVSENHPVTLSTTIYGAPGSSAPGGTIAFYNGTTALPGTVSYTRMAGSGGLSSSLVAGMTFTPTSPGTESITAQYSGDTNYQAATSPTTYLTVIGPDFAFSNIPNPVSISIATPGASGSSTLTISAQDGFTGTVSFSAACPPAPAEMTCVFNPASVTLTNGVTSVTTTLTVGTTAPSAIVPAGRPTGPLTPGEMGALALLFIFCVGLALIWRRTPQRRWSTALGLLALLSILAWAGCKGGASQPKPSGGSNAGTPSGSYSVGVTGTSGSLSHTVSVPVSVQ